MKSILTFSPFVRYLAFIFIISLTMSSCSSRAKLGDKVVDFTLTDVNGEKVNLTSTIQNSVSLIYFGSDVDQSDIRQDLSTLQKYYNGNEARLKVLAILFDSDPRDAARFSRIYNISYPILMGEPDLLTKYEIQSLPTTLFVDNKGFIAVQNDAEDGSSLADVLHTNLIVEPVDEVALELAEVDTSKIRLEYWRIWEKEEVFAPLIEKYEAMHPNVDIVYKQISKKNFQSKLLPALELGLGPDMFEIHASWLPYYIDQLEPIPPSVMTPQEYAETFYDFVRRAFATDMDTPDEKLWAIALGANTIALYYNKTIFRRAGLDPERPPRTWDDFLNYCLQIKKATNGEVYGAAIGSVGNVSQDHNLLEMIAVQMGQPPVSPDLKKSLVDQPKFVEALEFYTDFVKKYNIWSADAPPERQAFIEGKCAMVMSGGWYAGGFINAGIDFGVAPIPQIDLNNKYAHATFWGEVVSKDCKHPEVAWDFIKFCAERDNMLHYFRETKRSPTRRDAGEIARRENPLLEPFVEQAEYAGMWFKPWEIDWKEVQVATINKVINDVESPQEALTTAARVQTRMLQNYNKPYNFAIR
ncbi:MAG: extracellular solute-binding protein [Gemmatimonadetes bacterium]|nr:MAG: extracellular solute-binding protein [Gemmatimonadota bacterium]